MASTLPRIFVSHSHADNAWCAQLVDALTHAGLDVWFDKQGLYVGDQWVSKLEMELEGRDVFLIVLTPASWSSEWVRRELQLALHRRKRILGIMHKQTELTGFITTYQILDAVGENAQRVAQQIGTTFAAAVGGVPTSGGPQRELRTAGLYVAYLAFKAGYYHMLRFYPDGRMETYGSERCTPETLTAEAAAAKHASWSSLSVGSASFTLTNGKLKFVLGSTEPTTYEGTVTAGGDALVLTVDGKNAGDIRNRTYRFVPVNFIRNK
jgi:hypothetical protein